MTRGTIDSRSDYQLVQDHARGEASAFHELIARHQNKLWAVALRTTGNHDDASDALQEALLSIHTRADSFRNDCSVSSWMHRIVLNASLDRLRRVKHHSASLLFEDDESLIDPQDHNADIDLSVSIGRALDVLPAEQRAVIVLVDVYGHSVCEASRMLGVPEGTVKSRCNRARKKLALVLGHLRDDE
ncbi:RNA polymerase sigma factor SigM [Gordonia sp. PDNC005]|uniref:RNA polymerase sigma factor SigM n=1 Tax=unclassified Gordonia (in: high G+C Gram-positive bacteria) TaxID=2657482 RepID=UPI001962776C|nr:RNA polymerase sigma factor SigM [Gordonia sp. PDNC005]QRY62323.1 RNA polymerase sigma factor SigM [Gordonia sp. PDNC005]